MLPWQVSVVVAAIVYSAMRWIIPLQFKSPALVPVANAISGWAPLAGAFFILVGVISFIRNASSSAPSSFERASTPSSPQYERASPIVAPNTDWGLFAVRSATKSNITDWSIELLRVQGKRFEMLCAEYFQVLGKRVVTTSHGADGGVDARVYSKDSEILELAIQCKAWDSMVGVKPIRELFGVMAHESAGKGLFMVTSTFSEDAKKFASQHKDKLFWGVVSMLLKLPDKRKGSEFATAGDYTTPTCARAVANGSAKGRG
jgi:restriction system protein